MSAPIMPLRRRRRRRRPSEEMQINAMADGDPRVPSLRTRAPRPPARRHFRQARDETPPAPLTPTHPVSLCRHGVSVKPRLCSTHPLTHPLNFPIVSRVTSEALKLIVRTPLKSRTRVVANAGPGKSRGLRECVII